MKLEQLSESEIRILAGTFVPESQAIFYTKEAQESLEEFNEWESKVPAKKTNTKKLFSELKAKAQQRKRG